jgi:hypothetical protein
MLFSGIFKNPIAAKIQNENGVTSIIFYFINVLETGNEEAHDAIFNNKTDFECALETKKFPSLTRKTTSQSDLLKTETNAILNKGLDSFQDEFVPKTFFDEITKHKLEETLPPDVQQQPHLAGEIRTTDNNNFAESKVGGVDQLDQPDQLKGIFADFNQQIEEFRDELKRHTEKTNRTLLPSDSNYQSQHPLRRSPLIDQRKTEHNHGGLDGQCTETPSLDNTPTTGEMLYVEDDKLPYNTSADSSEKLKVVKLGKNVAGFSRGDTNTTTPFSTTKPSHTTSGKTLGSSREKDPYIEVEQPSDEQRKKDREKFLARFKKDLDPN